MKQKKIIFANANALQYINDRGYYIKCIYQDFEFDTHVYSNRSNFYKVIKKIMQTSDDFMLVRCVENDFIAEFRAVFANSKTRIFIISKGGTIQAHNRNSLNWIREVK